MFVLYCIIHVYDTRERKAHARKEREEDMMVRIDDDAESDEAYVWL